MRILNTYIAKNLLIVFTASIVVMTFLMISASVLRVLKYVQAAGFEAIFQIILLSFPEALTYAMPIAMLVATTLVFSRMSAENEITAMRASGIGLWEITAPGLLMSIIVSCICFYLNMNVIPNAKFQIRNFGKTVGINNPTAILEEGESVKLGDEQSIFIERREGNKLFNVKMEFSKDQKIVREIHAKTGDIKTYPAEKRFELVLNNIVIKEFKINPDGSPKISRIPGESITVPYDAAHEINKQPLARKGKYLGLTDTLARIKIREEEGDTKKATYLLFTINKQMALALSPFAFFIMGMPFGFRSSRSETSAGLIMAVFIMIAYFIVIFIAEAVKKKANLHPEIIVWLPNIIYQIVGIYLLRRISKT